MTEDRLHEIQSALRDLNISAWLLYNFRDTNPIAQRIMQVPIGMHQSRRWACLIPKQGPARGLVHRIEPHVGKLVPGSVQEYSSYSEFEAGLRDLINGVDRVAMEYSPNNALPVVSKVDAGTVEFLHSIGANIVSSGHLIAHIEARLTDDQIESAIRAGAATHEIMMGSFAFIRDAIESSRRLSEFDVTQYILSEFSRRNLITDHAPNCSVGPNSANPHYEPTSEASREIHRGDFVLIDLWGRENWPGSVYGDITWTGFVGTETPERYNEIFTIVRDARDAVVERVRRAFAEKQSVTGAELDDVARGIIRDAGYSQYFIHRTGHSITTELHGAGANLDNFETEDSRPIVAGTSFSVEPGIYLPGDFGVRSELDIVITNDGRVLTPSEPLQQDVIAVLTI